MKQKKLALILIPIFVLTIFWVIFNIYHNHVDSTIKDPLNYQIVPVEGTFDTKAINKIKERTRVNPANEISAPEEELSPSPTPELSEDIATETAETIPEEE